MFSFYIEYEYWFAATQLILAMLGMGATLTPSDFKDILLEPKSVSIGIGIQLMLIPILTYLFIHSFDITGGIAVGLALIASIPGGTVSNIFTHFAKGNTALSITITAITTVACLLTTPVILSLLIQQYMPNNFEMPTAKIASEIGLCLLLPLVAGMLCLKAIPKYAENISNGCIRGSILVIVMIVIGSLGAGRLDLKSFGLNNILLIIALMATFSIANTIVTRLFKLAQADTTAIDMEVIVRNVNLGILINASIFPATSENAALGNTVLFSLLLFGALQLAAGTAMIARQRFKTQS